jgi:hypothetical protein
MLDEDWFIPALLIGAVAFIIWAFVHTANKQEAEQKAFMGQCLQDHKQYECDVLWSSTDASKQTRDLAIGVAAGVAVGAAAGRK